MIKHLSLLILMACGSAAWARWNDLPADLDTFRERCHANRQHFTLDTPPAEGDFGYYPVGAVQSAQGRFTFMRATETIDYGLDQARKLGGEAHFLYDHGHAVFDTARPAEGVVYRGKIYLTDGNHKALATTYLNATTLGVRIRKVWDDKDTPEQFQKGMEEQGLGYWRDFQGKQMPMVDLCDLVNDPNLKLARIEIRRIEIERKAGTWALAGRAAKGYVSDRVVNAIKLNADIAFFEYYYADSLRRAGVVWSDDKSEDELTLADRQRHLALVRADAAANLKSPLNEMLLLEQSTRTDQLDIVGLVSGQIAKYGCERYFRN